MADKKRLASSENKIVSINGDVRDSTVIVGDNNTVNKTTIIQKIFNIFKSDSETLEQRNRRGFMIFLRRVGGGYIFIHRLLMEHFAEMYVESSTSKGK